MNLLFGHCNDFQKQVELKNLLEMFKNHEYKRLLNREYTNERLLNGNFLNYEPSDEESLKSLAFNPLTRFRRAPRGIYEGKWYKWYMCVCLQTNWFMKLFFNFLVPTFFD